MIGNIPLIILQAMPRETDVSLFTHHVTNGLIVCLSLIGLVFIVLIFIQNYTTWLESKQHNPTKKKKNSDLLINFIVSLIVFLALIYCIINGISHLM